jgi:hypothetical protein
MPSHHIHTLLQNVLGSLISKWRDGSIRCSTAIAAISSIPANLPKGFVQQRALRQAYGERCPVVMVTGAKLGREIMSQFVSVLPVISCNNRRDYL